MSPVLIAVDSGCERIGNMIFKAYSVILKTSIMSMVIRKATDILL